jgi:hypothetical protein
MAQPPNRHPGHHYAGPPPYRAHPYPYAAAYPPASFAPFRPARGLAHAAMVLAGLVALFEVVEAAMAWYSAEWLKVAAANGVAAVDIITPYDVIGVPLFGLLFAVWIVTALWLVQAQSNAHVLNPWMRHARSSVWAWLGWWMPVVALWFPYQLVRGVRLATVSEERRYSSVVGWWWALWLFFGLTTQVGAFIVSGTGPNESAVGLLGPDETLDAVVAVAAFVLWLRIVRGITEDQNLVAHGRPTATTV